jgi:anti-sigma B factor antagonist
MTHAASLATATEGPESEARHAPCATVHDFEPFATEARRVGETMHIFVQGELDCATVPSLEGRMDDVLHDGGGPVVLDLSALQFMDSSGARLAVRLESRAQMHGVHLSMRPGPRAVRRVFELTGMGRYAPRTARR